MSRRLQVTIGRDSPESIEAPETFRTDGSFGVDLDNRGRAVRVHVAVDDDLATVASVPEHNHHVESGGSLTVPVEVDGDGEATGSLTLATGYGREDRAVTVTVAPESAESTPVAPAGTGGARDGATGASSGRSVTDGVPLGLLGLAGLAVVVALGAAAVVGGPVGIAGALVVLAGIGVAGWLVLAGD